HGVHCGARHGRRHRRLARRARRVDPQRFSQQLLQGTDRDGRAALRRPRAGAGPDPGGGQPRADAVGPAASLMSAFQAMLAWFNDPLNWTNPDGILVRLREHLFITVLAVFFGALVAWPVGVWLGRRGSASGLIVVISNVTLAIPVTAMLT